MNASQLFTLLAAILFVVSGFVFTGILHLSSGAMPGGFGWSAWGVASLIFARLFSKPVS